MRALPIAIACALLLLLAAPAAAAERPPHFWHTAAQAVAIADKQPMVRPPAGRDPPRRVYLGPRLAWLGFRRADRSGSPLGTWAGNRVLVVGLAALVLGRIAANLLIGGVGDVGYASVFGAASIHEGWPLYVADHAHL